MLSSFETMEKAALLQLESQDRGRGRGRVPGLPGKAAHSGGRPWDTVPRHGEVVDRAAELRVCQHPRPCASVRGVGGVRGKKPKAIPSQSRPPEYRYSVFGFREEGAWRPAEHRKGNEVTARRASATSGRAHTEQRSPSPYLCSAYSAPERPWSRAKVFCPNSLFANDIQQSSPGWTFLDQRTLFIYYLTVTTLRWRLDRSDTLFPYGRAGPGYSMNRQVSSVDPNTYVGS